MRVVKQKSASMRLSVWPMRSTTALLLLVGVFTPPARAQISDAMADTGAVYGERGGGLQYGWNKAVNKAAVERKGASVSVPEYATFINMGDGSAGAVWEMAVPNGSYRLRVVAGDPAQWEGMRYRLQAEKILIIDGNPTQSKPLLEATAVVTVSDGKLTLSGGSGSTGNNLNYLEVETAEGTSIQALRPDLSGRAGHGYLSIYRKGSYGTVLFRSPRSGAFILPDGRATASRSAFGASVPRIRRSLHGSR